MMLLPVSSVIPAGSRDPDAREGYPWVEYVLVGWILASFRDDLNFIKLFILQLLMKLLIKY